MGAEGHRTVSRVDYASYIQSPAWSAVRARFVASNLPKLCTACGKPWGKGDHLHHRTYKNLGAERLMDLVPMCPGCHKEVHVLYNSDPKWQRKGLWYATREVIRRPKRKGNPR